MSRYLAVWRFPITLMLGLLLPLALAAPAGAATTGTLCGEVTAFTAPTVATDGSITIDGTVQVIDSSAAASLAAATITTLTTVAAADATTCLDITANAGGAIISLDIAAQAQVCGTASIDSTTGLVTVGNLTIPANLLTANADATALLNAAADADANVCLNLTINSTTGLITSVRVNATIGLCGTLEALTADTATINGVDVPLSMLDADARAALQLAANANSSVCVNVVVTNTRIVDASVNLKLNLCGDVTLDANGNVMVDGTLIPADLLDADVLAALKLAATAEGDGCVAVNVGSTGGTTTVNVSIEVNVCATVTAVGNGTISLDGVTFDVAAGTGVNVAVGEKVCTVIHTAPGGNVEVSDITHQGATAPGATTPPVASGASSGPVLPDTSMAPDAPLKGIGALMLLAGGLGLTAVRRRRA